MHWRGLDHGGVFSLFSLDTLGIGFPHINHKSSLFVVP